MATPIEEALEAVKKSELEAATREIFDNPQNPQLTFGPEDNTLSGDYRAGTGVWDINFLDKLSADTLLIYLSKMSQMYRKVGSATLTAPVPRDVKDILLRDAFPIHTLRDL